MTAWVLTSMEAALLTPYDEFPVHQSPHPFSHIPSADLAWDDGYYYGVFGPDADVFVFTGLRVTPNTDTIGGYAGIVHGDRQYTVRFSRPWQPDFEVRVGPLRYTVVEAFREVRLQLEPNDSALEFDLTWLATAPAFEESHHRSQRRERVTTDQTRYSQSGTARGHVVFDGQRSKVEPGTWFATRDHSWGVYDLRPPLAPEQRWLPPVDTDPTSSRSLRWWYGFTTEHWSGFYHFHEDHLGRAGAFNDVFGNPFEGHIARSWNSAPLALVAVQHEIELVPKSRVLQRARVDLTDRDGGLWVQEIERSGHPWHMLTIGYHPGGWTDGGTLNTWHGDQLRVEWDERTASSHAVDFVRPDGSIVPGTFAGEHMTRLTMTAPDGSIHTGGGNINFKVEGRYDPLGLT